MISTVEKVLFLKSIDLFSQIPGEDLSQIAQITDEVRFDEGDDIFREGEPGDSLYLVIQGRVRVHRSGTELAVLGQRQVFGEMALLDAEPRSASVLALSELVLLRIASDDFHEILIEKGEIALGVIRVLTRRLRNTLGMQPLPDASPSPATPESENLAAPTEPAAPPRARVAS